MPLASSGEIKLSEIRNEFGLGSGQIAMSSLYGKGNAAASGQVRMGADFHGTAGSVVAGSITRGAIEDKSNRWIVGRHDNTPNSGANIGSISYSTSETFGNRFFYDAPVSTDNTFRIVPNNATAYTKIDKITIGGRTYTRRRASGSQFSSTGEMFFATNYQNNYVKDVQNIGQALSSSPFTSSSAMSFTGEEDRSFFCDTSFVSGSPSTQSSSNTKLNTSTKRDFRGFQTSTNNGNANNTTFGTQSNITLTNPDFSSSTCTMTGFYARKIRNWNNSNFSGAPASTDWHLFCIIDNTSLVNAPHPSNAGGGTFATNQSYWMKLNGLKRFEITVGGTTHYYNFGKDRSSLLGGTIANCGFENNSGDSTGIWALTRSGGGLVDSTVFWNHIGSGNTVNIKLY